MMDTYAPLILNTFFCLVFAKPDSLVTSVDVVAPANVVPAAVIAEPVVALSHVPAQIGTAISKTVHYAETPVLSGYTSALYKADLSAFDSPFKFNLNHRYLRPVKTIIPKVMMEQPKTHVEIPMVAQLRELEMHPPILPEVRMANPVYYPPVIAPLIH